MSEMIKTEKLVFSYADTLNRNERILKKIDLSIPEGQFVAILGRNGSGKSTLAKHFNAIHLPEGGKVYIDGKDTSLPENLITVRTKASMVFQNPDNQIVSSVVEEDVAFALENLGIPSHEIRRRVDAALKTVGMYGFRMHSPNLLSGGQKQRVAIAGVLAIMPRCIVFDEPTSMLDPQGRAEVMEVIRRLHQDFQITVVLITHHMEEAVQAERVIILEKGRIVMDGTPRDIFARTEDLASVGLAPPDTIQLIQMVSRAAGVQLPADALTLDECADRLEEFLRGGGVPFDE